LAGHGRSITTRYRLAPAAHLLILVYYALVYKCQCIKKQRKRGELCINSDLKADLSVGTHEGLFFLGSLLFENRREGKMASTKDTMDALIRSKPIKCEECGGKLMYHGLGEYICDECGHIMWDYYGRVRNFLNENGSATKEQIVMETGVPEEVIDSFLTNGQLEVPKSSRYLLKCSKCGCSIQYGRMCKSCYLAVTNDLKGAMMQDDGQKDRRIKKEPPARMRTKH